MRGSEGTRGLTLVSGSGQVLPIDLLDLGERPLATLRPDRRRVASHADAPHVLDGPGGAPVDVPGEEAGLVFVEHSLDVVGDGREERASCVGRDVLERLAELVGGAGYGIEEEEVGGLVVREGLLLVFVVERGGARFEEGGCDEGS